MPSVSQCPSGTSLVFPAVTSGRNEPRRRFLSPAISARERALLCSVTREEWNGRGGKWDERTEVVVVVAQEGFPCLRPTTQPSFPSAPSVRPSVRPSVPFSERPLFSRPLLFLPPRPPFVSLFLHSQGNATAGLIVLRLRLLPPRLSCPLVQRTNRPTQKEEPPPPSDRGATSTPPSPFTYSSSNLDRRGGGPFLLLCSGEAGDLESTFGSLRLFFLTHGARKKRRSLEREERERPNRLVSQLQEVRWRDTV